MMNLDTGILEPCWQSSRTRGWGYVRLVLELKRGEEAGAKTIAAGCKVLGIWSKALAA